MDDRPYLRQALKAVEANGQASSLHPMLRNAIIEVLEPSAIRFELLNEIDGWRL